MKKYFILILFILSLNTFAQDLSKGINYVAELCATTGNGTFAPLWMTANRHGLSSIDNSSAYLRTSISRPTSVDSTKSIKFGYGADIAITENMSSKFILQQLYAEADYKKGRLLIGSKQLPLIIKNQELSSGDMTYNINARPIPQIRLELKDYWNIPLTDGWFAFKGHVAYGWFTDGNWQEDFIKDKLYRHSKGVKFHSKTGYILVGKQEIFPVTLLAGVHFCSMFGGEVWNVGKRMDDTSNFDQTHVSMGNGIKNYLKAFFPGGKDASDGDYSNAEGNHLGSYQACLTFHGKDWELKGYAEHFFEDHSQIFFQYKWKDFLWGMEAKLPNNPFVGNIVCEYLNTTDQTGSIYHDHTANLPIQISGTDDYYNHNIYGGWHHFGQGMGNPLLISPIYNDDRRIQFYHNRITAYHFGISGNPSKSLHYRLLYSHVRSLGTYNTPLMDATHGSFLLTEVSMHPEKFNGYSMTIGYGANIGHLLGHSNGVIVSIKKTGLLQR